MQIKVAENEHYSKKNREKKWTYRILDIEKNLNVSKTKPVAPRGRPLLLLLFFQNKSCMHNEVGTCTEILPANVPFERHLFRQISQSSEETVDQLVCRLRQRAASCEFGEREDEYIRDQLIDKCSSAKLRRKVLEKEGSVALNDCYEFECLSGR